MRHRSAWGRRTFIAVLAVGVAVLGNAVPANAAPNPATPTLQANPADSPKDAPADTLGAHDADLLSKAESTGARNVTLIIATDDGKVAEVAAQVKSLGGTVTRRFDKVGYVLAQVPTASVVKAAKLPGVSAIDLDEKVKLPDPSVEQSRKQGARQAATLPGPGPSTPAANPYMPTNEIGSVTFKAKHPTWDGRGVTIGIMDSGVDLENPALKTTSTGERKIVDWVTATDPLLEGDGTWRAMLSAPPAGVKVPAGTFLYNVFRESITAASDPAGDVNRDGDQADVFGILYDPASHDIRVDVNQNNDFTDDAVMRPYKEKFDVGHFGTDNPATEIVERMPFVVEYREDVDLTPAGLPGQKADFVNIGIPEAVHGSHVAGITAANNMLGNDNLDGQAPGAKIVSARACSWGGGCTAAALTTGMVDLVVNRHVDVVNMSIGGLPTLNDGQNARAELYNRLIEDYGVQMFISAGNSGPGENTIGDPSVADNVVSVAASVSKETWLANYGSVVRKKNALFNFSSRGPREDGGFKPNITAPGSAISTVNTWIKEPDVAEAGYVLPIGVAMLNGTSMASPQAAGAAALLLSAAKATDKGVTPSALRRALYTSADPIKGEPVAGQGYGLLDVNGAWPLLKKEISTARYTSSAPVCTALYQFLGSTEPGVGIHNRCVAAEGGQRAGSTRVYNVKITRTSGSSKSVRHTLSWLGDTGQFKSARSVSLPLNKAVTVPVTVKAKEGLNSGLLKVDDPATAVVDFEILNTVITSTSVKAPSYTLTGEGSVERNSTKSYFIVVPEGATTLQVDLTGIATGSQTRWIAINPYGVPVESTSSLNCYTNFSDPAVCKPQERSYDDPLPGVWELEVESRRTSPTLNNPYRLLAKVQGVTVTPETVTLDSVEAGTPTPVTWTVKNNYGPINLTARGGSLGSAKSDRPTIADGASQEYEVVVPAGAERLDVSIGNPSDAAADLDLAVYLGSTLIAQQADGDSDEAVSIPSPAAGTYTVVVDGYSVPSGSTAYDYRDVYYSSALGTVSVPAGATSLASGASATVTGSVTATAAPPAGRSLFGEVTFLTDEGAVVGRGSVQ
ncbi:S8 family serine peptidase, partial [Actinoplanes sp. NPDC051633]|uniref:S8 family serine peptidase n=1 Tax=Actinoplanes sp. NPDC051633 TaxID=3155670 RepID=UPI0034301202